MSFLLSFLFSATSVFAQSPLTFPANGVKSIVVSVPKGKISIASSKTQKDISVLVTELKKETDKDKKCIKTVGLENTQLVAKVSSENILFEKADCQYDIAIVTPVSKMFDMDITSGSAIVSLREVNGNINLKTATGNVDIAGDVIKNISAKTATGELVFNYKTCSGRADVDVISATAKATIILPATCKIRVDYKSATGKLFNAIGEAEDYQVMINAKSASGDLTIGKK